MLTPTQTFRPLPISLQFGQGSPISVAKKLIPTGSEGFTLSTNRDLYHFLPLSNGGSQVVHCTQAIGRDDENTRRFTFYKLDNSGKLVKIGGFTGHKNDERAKQIANEQDNATFNWQAHLAGIPNNLNRFFQLCNQLNQVDVQITGFPISTDNPEVKP